MRWYSQRSRPKFAASGLKGINQMPIQINL